ncbi:thermonuclease family protein, partial [Salmonella enterica subsp. enterica serovar Typhimurium]|nr:thermonuclease family protein [Salmonella enterica subsp. enterica serovar Typhimurium]
REENEARKNRLGLWHDNEAIEPWKWRKLHNQHKE